MTTTTKAPATTDTPPVAVPDEGAGLRYQALPWAAMGCLVIAASAARIAVHATGSDLDVATTVALTAFSVAVVAGHVSGRRLMSRKLRKRFIAALYLGASWLTMTTAVGLTLGAVARLVIIGAGLSLLYWREHRITVDTDAPVPVDLVEPDNNDLYADRWDKYLGGEGKQFAGSKLVQPEIIKAGYRYLLQLVPGAHTVEQVRGVPDTLRSGLRLMPGQDVIVEVHPTAPAPAAVLTIVTRPQVSRPQKWPGPEAAFDPRAGAVNLGPFVDGEGVGHFTVYKQDGIFGGYIQGGNGSGKSRMIDSIAMSLAASTTHPTVIWYGDGQNGSSSPLLAEHADYAALTNEAIFNMLIAAVDVMKINGVENRLNRHVGFHPTVDRPGLFAIIDECHNCFDPNRNPLLAAACQALALRIAREGRKVGVALLMASQSPTLDAFGGAGNGADTLRACLLQGNGIILRSKTKNAKQVFDVDINPSRFPKLPGYSYLCDPEEGARSAPLRSFWVTDEMAKVWPQRITWRSLPTRQANAAGSAYAKRREVAAEQAMNDALLLQYADAGMLAEFEALQRQMNVRAAAMASIPVIEFDDAHPPVRRVERFWMPEVRTSTGLLPGQQKVFDAVRAGATSPKQIRESTQYSNGQVYNLIDELVQLGRIGKTGYGQYQAAA